MRMTVGLLAITAVLLAGCSDNGNGASAGRRTAGSTAAPVGRLDDDTVCGMVDRATVEKLFGEPIANVRGGVNPPEQRSSVGCGYISKSFVEADTEDLDNELMVSTDVTLSDADTAKDALDASLTDSGKTVAYQPVAGLGLAVGYARSELNVLSGGSRLAAIIEIDGAFVEVVVKAEPEGTLDQLRPIADELVSDVEQELR